MTQICFGRTVQQSRILRAVLKLLKEQNWGLGKGSKEQHTRRLPVMTDDLMRSVGVVKVCTPARGQCPCTLLLRTLLSLCYLFALKPAFSCCAGALEERAFSLVLLLLEELRVDVSRVCL